jgi:hypothetical protein
MGCRRAHASVVRSLPVTSIDFSFAATNTRLNRAAGLALLNIEQLVLSCSTARSDENIGLAGVNGRTGASQVTMGSETGSLFYTYAPACCRHAMHSDRCHLPF